MRRLGILLCSFIRQRNLVDIVVDSTQLNIISHSKHLTCVLGIMHRFTGLRIWYQTFCFSLFFSLSLSLSFSICLSVCVPTCLSICLSIYLSIYLSLFSERINTTAAMDIALNISFPHRHQQPVSSHRFKN